MFENTFVLLIILLACIALYVLRRIYKALFREEVSITTFNNGAPPLNIGILDYSNNTDDGLSDRNEVAVVRITGASFDTPYIGRVLVDNNHRAIVHVIASDLELEAETPFYRPCGYVDVQGYVHEIVNGRDVKVGYMAQPSQPNTPTINGEWHWYSFWKRELNAYSGKPQSGKAKEENKNNDADAEDNGRERPQLVAECVRRGFHIGGKDAFPSEARACGYALFFKKKRSVNNYSDYYNNPSNLWKDTALLATIVYSVIYLILFLINTQVMRVPLFGRNIYGMMVVSSFYFVVWAAVREMKIKKAEWSSSIKPQLDLLNKSIGIRLTDRMITVLASAVVSLCLFFYNLENLLTEFPVLVDYLHLFTNFTHYDFDFLPLANAIFIGLTINRTQRSVPLPWNINSGLEENEDESGTDVVKNPKGKIDVTYDWQLDSFNNVALHGQVTLHFNKEEYIDLLRQDNPFYPQVIDHLNDRVVREMFHYMLTKPRSREHLRYLAYYINEMASRKNLANIDRLQFALDFVQEPNIQYREVHGSKSLDFAVNYMRFPDETLYDKEGDFNCKAFLAAALFYEMGSDVFFLYSENYKIAGVAVEIPYSDLVRYISTDMYDDVVLEKNGKRFLFCDVVCDVFKIGQIEEGKSIRDFDVKIDFFHNDENQEENSSNYNIDNALPPSVTKDVTYQWELDSLFGTRLKGMFKLHFEEDYIDRLRTDNPYASDNSGLTNQENVELMCAYMRKHDETLSNLKKIAEYIRHTIASEKLNKADALQFILDFVQEPNIKYQYDSESSAIGNPKQYVRFPDETLYDKVGDCDCKTMLASQLFKECGFDTLFLISTTYQHAALAVACDQELLDLLNNARVNATKLVHNGVEYLFCETTGDGFKVGQIVDGEDVAQFDLIIPIF
ncbi:MAG: hypothetical protein K6G31_04320 [Paludibacteraceae bacterium]|nr:hypothetical protein [Paludibacteraceae bacterium]